MVAEIESGSQAQAYKDALAELRKTIDETLQTQVDAGLVTCGSQKSLLQVISYCARVLRTKKTHIALSVLSVLIGAAIVTLLLLAGKLTVLTSLIIAAYHLAWLIPTMITSRVFVR